MVNASLNWASIVGIALAICGGGLYFLRSFKPALARDYDVFFAAIGLLCGGILFFQGWRLDPILQFGQFLLAGTTVFFAYESVRLRGIATDQARRSSYFDDELESPPRSSSGFRSREQEDFDQFQTTEPIRRRFAPRDKDISEYDSGEDDFYRSRRTTRPAIPEEAASRRTRSQRGPLKDDSMKARRMARFENNSDYDNQRRSNFGDRRSFRQEERRGSRPRANSQTSRIKNDEGDRRLNFDRPQNKYQSASNRYSSPQGTPISENVEDAAFSSPGKQTRRERLTKPESSERTKPSVDLNSSSRNRRSNATNLRPRDNSSRFDD